MGAMSQVNAQIIQEETLNLKVGDTVGLTLSQGYYNGLENNIEQSLTSSNSNIVTVDNDGNVTALKEGDSTITYKVDEYTETVSIHVDGKATDSGLGNGLRGILDFIMKAITKILQAIVNPLANKALQTILPK